MKNEFIISTDKRKLDFKTIHSFLTECYWSNGISMKLIKKAASNSICEYMKMTTLEKLYDSLWFEQFEVKVPEELSVRARILIERMLSII